MPLLGPALAWQERGIKGPWTKWTWAEYFNNCRAFAKSLVSLGVEPHKYDGVPCSSWLGDGSLALLFHPAAPLVPFHLCFRRYLF